MALPVKQLLTWGKGTRRRAHGTRAWRQTARNAARGRGKNKVGRVQSKLGTSIIRLVFEGKPGPPREKIARPPRKVNDTKKRDRHVFPGGSHAKAQRARSGNQPAISQISRMQERVQARGREPVPALPGGSHAKAQRARSGNQPPIPQLSSSSLPAQLARPSVFASRRARGAPIMGRRNGWWLGSTSRRWGLSSTTI